MADAGQLPPEMAAGRPQGVAPARWAALRVLLAVEDRRIHSDDALHGAAAEELSDVDRNLMMALVLGVLRWQLALDAEWQPLLSRPDAELQPVTRLALRLGLFQLRHLERVPAHAALGESVEMCKAAGAAHAAGMVNALLRKLANTPAKRPKLVERLPEMATRLGHPVWLVRRWEASFGRSATQRICEADQGEPIAGSLFTEALPGPDGEPLRLDDGSRLVAELAVRVAPEGATTAWDMCAAPGGKTIVLSRSLPAAAWLATDVSPARTHRLERRLARWAPAVRVERADAELARAGEFDLVLCDAPCSGTGTLARNPEIRLRLEPADLGRQHRRQVKLLRAALASLRVGGRCLYATCSLEPEECDAAVEAVLNSDGGSHFARVPLDAPLRELQTGGVLNAGATEIASWLRAGSLRTLPGANFRGDGFYACALERRG